MKRDLQLIKKILLKIEEEYVNAPLMNISLDGYTKEQIANHCELLKEEGLLNKYKAYFADNSLYIFYVGNLTNEGFNYLDTIRDTDDLESHKSFNVYLDQSIKIGDGNELSNTNINNGDKNGQE